MKRIFRLITTIEIIFILSCHHDPEKKSASKMDMRDQAVNDSSKKSLQGLSYKLNRDPVCGMPLSAGLKDTAYYKNELYGFCSKDCKEEFLKNPTAYLAAK